MEEAPAWLDASRAFLPAAEKLSPRRYNEERRASLAVGLKFAKCRCRGTASDKTSDKMTITARAQEVAKAIRWTVKERPKAIYYSHEE